MAPSARACGLGEFPVKRKTFQKTGNSLPPAREAGQSLWRAVSSAEATVALSLSRFVGTL